MALTPRDRRALIILGSVVVVGGLAFFLLSGGDGAPDEEAAPAPGAPSPPPSPEVSPPPGVPVAPPVTVFGRDPFMPLVGDVADADEDGDGDVNGDGAAVTEPGRDAETRQGGTMVGGHQVNLLDIFVRNGEEQAQVQVDGDTFVVSEGERFSQNFRLVSIDGTCANFQHGDENFTLCEPGEKK